MKPTASVIAELFRHAARSPSPHNTQPWVPRFEPAATDSPAKVHLHVDPARTLPIGDPNSEDLHLAMGCWVESFTIAAAEVGLTVDIESVRGRGPALEIRLTISEADRAEEGRGGEADSVAGGRAGGDDAVPSAGHSTRNSGWPSFTSSDLHHRQVDRGPMVRDQESFEAAFTAANHALADSGARLVEVPDPLWEWASTRSARQSFARPAIAKETLEWLRFDSRDPRYGEDGLSKDCLRISGPAARLAARLNTDALRPWIGRLTSAVVGSLELIDDLRDAKPKSSVVVGIPAPSQLNHVILAKDGDRSPRGPSIENDIELGRSLLRIWLLLDRAGLRVDVHSEIKDHPTTRSEISDALLSEFVPRAVPVAAFSAGRSTDAVPRSHRLSVEGMPS